jgi:hypothetical protein
LAFFAAALALNAYLLWTSKAPPAPITRFEITLPRGADNFTLSPDGRKLVILAPGPDGRHMLWLRSLDSLDTQPMPGTENVLGPPVFWSPDSRFVAFQALGKLRKIDASGGPPQNICDTSYAVLGGAWNRDDTILIGTDTKGILRVPASGGVPVAVTTTGNRNEAQSFPSFLSDGRHFVYLRAPEDPGIFVASIDETPQRQSSTRIVATPVMAVYVPSFAKARCWRNDLMKNSFAWRAIRFLWPARSERICWQPALAFRVTTCSHSVRAEPRARCLSCRGSIDKANRWEMWGTKELSRTATSHCHPTVRMSLLRGSRAPDLVSMKESGSSI